MDFWNDDYARDVAESFFGSSAKVALEPPTTGLWRDAKISRRGRNDEWVRLYDKHWIPLAR